MSNMCQERYANIAHLSPTKSTVNPSTAVLFALLPRDDWGQWLAFFSFPNLPWLVLGSFLTFHGLQM